MVSVQKLKEVRGYVIVVAFIIAAIVTPPDVVSQFMLAVPLIVLYEIGIIFAKGIKSRDKNSDESDSPLSEQPNKHDA